eukprot:1176864-Prorocentrum_minimum.AAC.1
MCREYSALPHAIRSSRLRPPGGGARGQHGSGGGPAGVRRLARLRVHHGRDRLRHRDQDRQPRGDERASLARRDALQGEQARADASERGHRDPRPQVHGAPLRRRGGPQPRHGGRQHHAHLRRQGGPRRCLRAAPAGGREPVCGEPRRPQRAHLRRGGRPEHGVRAAGQARRVRRQPDLRGQDGAHRRRHGRPGDALLTPSSPPPHPPHAQVTPF